MSLTCMVSEIVGFPQIVRISFPMITLFLWGLKFTDTLVIPSIFASSRHKFSCAGRYSGSFLEFRPEADLELVLETKSETLQPASLLHLFDTCVTSWLITRQTIISPLVKPFRISTWRISPCPEFSS